MLKSLNGKGGTPSVALAPLKPPYEKGEMVLYVKDIFFLDL